MKLCYLSLQGEEDKVFLSLLDLTYSRTIFTNVQSPSSIRAPHLFISSLLKEGPKALAEFGLDEHLWRWKDNIFTSKQQPFTQMGLQHYKACLSLIELINAARAGQDREVGSRNLR